MTWEDGEPELGTVYTPALEELLGPARRPDEELTQRHKDLAASLQAVYEERFFALVRALAARTGLKRLALAGGCAMNSLANGKLFERTDVEDVFIQAAAGDAGTALGAALYVAPRRARARPAASSWSTATGDPRYGEAEIRARHRRAAPRLGGPGRPLRRDPDRDRPRRGPPGGGDRRGDRARARWSAGTRGARSGDRAPSATARSSPTRGAAT